MYGCDTYSESFRIMQSTQIKEELHSPPLHDKSLWYATDPSNG